MVLLAGVAVPIAAQEASSPSVTLNDATIDINAGENSQVTATYKFKVENPGSGEKQLSTITGTIWRFSGHEVSDISATVNGEEVSSTVSKESRFMDLSVPVSDVNAGETVTVKLSYTVASSADKLKTPLWVPEYETTGTDRVIDMTVALSDGAQVQGATFPKIDSKDGNVLQYQLIHMPGFVSLQYGQGAGSFFTLDVLSTLAGLVMIFGFLGLWAAWRKGFIGQGGEGRVA